MGSVIMAGIGIVAINRWSDTQLWFFLLLALRDFVASYQFWNRLKPVNQAPRIWSLVAYVSSALPLLYAGDTGHSSNWTLLTAEIFAIFGFLLVALATIELSERLGVSPAVRGERCTSGIYRYVTHPMYTGYFLAELGLVILNPTNLVLFAASATLYVSRARIESKLLQSPNKN